MYSHEGVMWRPSPSRLRARSNGLWLMFNRRGRKYESFSGVVANECITPVRFSSSYLSSSNLQHCNQSTYIIYDSDSSKTPFQNPEPHHLFGHKLLGISVRSFSELRKRVKPGCSSSNTVTDEPSASVRSISPYAWSRNLQHCLSGTCVRHKSCRHSTTSDTRKSG